MANIAANAANILGARIGVLPRCLLELQTVDGTRYYISDGAITVTSAIGEYDLGGPLPANFVPWLIDPPQFADTGTLVTATSTTSFQNYSGNTVARDGTSIFSKQKLWGAVFVFRIWLTTAQSALRTYIGTVTDVEAEADGDTVELTLQKLSNWSEITAPDCNVDPNCQLTFGSPACGSTSPTPCQNSYGTCSQIARFKGAVTIWDNGVLSVGERAGVAQPPPPSAINNRRPG